MKLNQLKWYNHSQGKGIFLAISCLLGIAIPLTSPFLFLLLFFYLYYLHQRFHRSFLFICIGLSLCSFFYSVYSDRQNITKLQGTETTFIGYIQDDMVINGNYLSFSLMDNRNERLVISYVLKTIEEKQWAMTLNYGDYVQVAGQLQKPRTQRMPNGFDYEQYLRYKGIHYTVKGQKIVSIDKQKQSFSLFMRKIRNQGIARIKEVYAPTAASFINALVFGDRGGMDETLQQQYRTYGISHLLAISGTHFTLLVGAVSVLLWRLGVTREKTMICLMIGIPFYILLAGAAPSVIRAGLTSMLVMVSFFFQQKQSPLDVLSIACMLFLFFNPYYVGDIGFQLSFLVSASLFLSSPFLLQRTTSYLQLTFSVTIIAQLCSLPIILYHFYEISPYSLLLNLFFVPFLVFLLLPLCIVAAILSGTPFAPLMESILVVLLEIGHFLLNLVSFLPFGVITFGTFSFFFVCCLCSSLYVFFVRWERKQLKKGVYPLVTVLVLLYLLPIGRLEGRVTFLDVGQGDCVVIELPFRQGVYVIDTGGAMPFEIEEWKKGNNTYRVGEKVVVPYLKSRGIRQIDKLILTHGDYDHMGEVDIVLEEIKVKEMVVGKKEKRTNLEKEMLAKAHEKGVVLTEVSSGMEWRAGDVVFSILSPYETMGEENNQSVVIYVSLGGMNFLFTGDLEEEGEKRLVERYATLPVDILKVGHHGSKSSTSQRLLEAYIPSVAVISVGENNRYNHPNSEVLQRLGEKNITILRTDQHGTIIYSFRGKKGTLQRTVHTVYHT